MSYIERIRQYGSDSRWVGLIAGLDQLTNEQLLVLEADAISPESNLLLDAANFDPHTQKWCALAIALKVPTLATSEKLCIDSNNAGRGFLIDVGRTTLGDDFSTNPLSGIRGEAFTSHRLDDLLLAVRGLSLLRHARADGCAAARPSETGADVVGLLLDRSIQDATGSTSV
jgi:hypothetical protein